MIKAAEAHRVDLIAMSTHGHRFISDLLYGSTADKVRHLVDVPVLLLKASAERFLRLTNGIVRASERLLKRAGARGGGRCHRDHCGICRAGRQQIAVL